MIVLFSVLIIFVSLRYVLVDDYFFKIFNISDRHISFFKNYPFSHTMSFWSGMKNSISIISLLPIIYFSKAKKYVDSVIFLCLSGLISIINLPASFVLFFVITLGIFSFISVVIGFFLFLTFAICYNMDFFSNLISINNLFLENYYWTILPFAILALFRKKNSKLSLYIFIVSILFPFIYINHSLGFKIFISIFLGFMVFNWRKIIYGYYFDVFTSFLILFISSKILSGINFEFGQIFYNSFLVLIIVLISEIISGNFDLNISKNVQAFILIFYLVVVCIPPLFYDVKIPNHTERLRVEAFREKNYNAVSIAEFTHLPYLFQDILGDGLIASSDRFLVCPGGFEFLSIDERNKLLSNHRVTKSNFFFSQAAKIYKPSFYTDLVNGGKINCLLVENKAMFSDYNAHFVKHASKAIYEPNRNYFIYLFD